MRQEGAATRWLRRLGVAVGLLVLMRPAAALPTLGFGEVTLFNRYEIYSQKLNVTTLDQLDCDGLAASEALAAARDAPPALAGGGPGSTRAGGAGRPACSRVLREGAWLKPVSGNDTRGAWLAMSLARDSYPKMHETASGAPMIDGPEFKCAWAAKLRRLGADNVTFISGTLINAAVARAGRNVYLIIRGTDSDAEEENNGLWASDEALLWYRLVRVHGGFLTTARHALPLVAALLQEALAQARAPEPAAAAAPAPAAGGASAAGGGAAGGGPGAAAGAPAAEPAEPRLYLIGHSRGGGLATVLAAQLDSVYFKTVGKDLAGVYTFGAPKVGNKRFVQGYAYHLGKITYAWWNQQDVVPFLPPQVWLGYHHLNPESRWRIWDGACQQARCGLQDMLGGKTCVARDCPNMAAAVCGFNLERDHPQNAYVSKLKACMPEGAVPEACISAV